MTNDKLLSQTISYLRFPLTVGVVFIHFNLTKGLTLPSSVYGLNCPDWYFYFVQFFSSVLPRIAVPLFFFISGFLFFYHTEFNGDAYKRKLCIRARTLLIPFLLWNTITLLQQSARVLPFFSSLVKSADSTEFHFSLVRLFNTFFNHDRYNGIVIVPIESDTTNIDLNSYPIDIPMWYVRDLMVMVLLTPAIYWMVKRMGKWAVISIGIIKYCIISEFFPHGGYPSQFVTALFFFSWGSYFSVNKLNFIETMRKYKYIPLIYIPVAIVDTLTKRTDYNFYFHNLGILLGIISAIIITSYLVEKKKVKVNPTLANASFFVYAFHYMVLYNIGKIVVQTFHLPDTLYTMVTLYFVVPAITIILCLVIYKVLKKYATHICNLLTGGR